MRLDVLIRQSQREDESRSPKQQLERCQRCAEINGYTIGKVHDSGRSESGKTMARGTVEAALERIRRGQADGVIVAWLDRFGRAPIEEAMSVLRDIAHAGGTFVSADNGLPIDSDDPMAETNLVVQLQIARQQWRQTAKRHALNREDAIRDGKALACPFGYRYKDPTKKPSGRGVIDSRLVPDEQTAHLIPKLFERKANGGTWLELARWLDEVAPKPNGKVWSRQTVSGMIKSRTYLGEVRHGEYVNPKAHDALVSPALWRRAQNDVGRRTPRGTYLLTGLAYCAGCGLHLYGNRKGKGNRYGAELYRVYHCQNRACPSRSTITADRLDEEITRQFFDFFGPFEWEDQTGNLTEAEAEVKRLTTVLEAQASVIVTHPSAVKAHQEALSELESQLAEAEDYRDSLLPNGAQKAVQEIIQIGWSDVALTVRQEVLRFGIDRVEVARATGKGPASVISERVSISWKH